MAVCELGYLCDVCGQDVAELVESDLYLRFILGEVDPETLHVTPERHIRCNPVLAQFIVADGFPTAVVQGYFSKTELDASFVSEEESRVTAGYLRLLEVSTGEMPIVDYPPPEVADRWRGGAESGSSPSLMTSSPRG